MLFLGKLNQEFSSSLSEEIKAFLALSLFLLVAKKKLLSCRFDSGCFGRKDSRRMQGRHIDDQERKEQLVYLCLLLSYLSLRDFTRKIVTYESWVTFIPRPFRARSAKNILVHISH